MAFSTITIQPASQPVTGKPVDTPTAASLLSMLVLSVYAAQKSKRSMRKLKRRFMWTAMKLKLKSYLSKKQVSDRVLIYILLGVVALVLVFYYPLLALIVAAAVLVLILAGVI